ncbi:DUF1564 family protein [Leptospira sp. 201903070]|uniref:DUF1564 family protein n=1 Tax=Leptospira ainlahdjerensis TaxID=2810033 RepID=A0ABS2U9P5_9LEPT|nr:DUF1564 family protein [Leptospira ainlahdjerensis]MBM9576499.1 DUF1564 family protein [Leptospira ainlahdjerensis]
MGKAKYPVSSKHFRSLSEKGDFESYAQSKSKRASSSDLWIPKRHALALKRRIARFGSLKNFLSLLLARNRSKFPSMFAFSKSEKTIYQNTNLDLVRFSFRPNSSDWAELRIVARYYGLSICHFFVMLIQIEEAEASEIPQFEFGKSNDLRTKGKRAGISLSQRILPGRKLISFSILFRSSLRKSSLFDS